MATSQKLTVAPSAVASRVLSGLKTSPPAVASTGAHELKIAAIEEAWLSLAVDDQPTKQYLLRAGETRSWSADVFSLTVGNAGGVTASAVTCVLLIAGVSFYIHNIHAEQHKTEAALRQVELERALAQSRFNDVRKLANTFLFAFHDKIQDLAGATPARELLVKTSLEYLNKLSADAGDDRPNHRAADRELRDR